MPAVLYGHGTDPVHITLPGHDTMLALKHGGANALLELDVDGKAQLALPKQVQLDPIKGFLEHLDLVVVRKGEKVTVDIPVHLVGDAAPRRAGRHREQPRSRSRPRPPTSPSTSRSPSRAPRSAPRSSPRTSCCPQGSTLLADDDTLIVNITHAPTAEEVEAELAEAEAEVGIERDEPEEPREAAEGEAAEGRGARARSLPRAAPRSDRPSLVGGLPATRLGSA